MSRRDRLHKAARLTEPTRSPQQKDARADQLTEKILGGDEQQLMTDDEKRLMAETHFDTLLANGEIDGVFG